MSVKTIQFLAIILTALPSCRPVRTYWSFPTRSVSTRSATWRFSPFIAVGHSSASFYSARWSRTWLWRFYLAISEDRFYGLRQGSCYWRPLS